MCLVKYIHTAHYDPRRITKAGKVFGYLLDFEDIKFPVKIKDTHKIEKSYCISIIVFRYENKVKYPIYESKKCFGENNADLLMIREEGKIVCSYQRF